MKSANFYYSKGLLIAAITMICCFTACKKTKNKPNQRVYFYSQWWQREPGGGERHLQFYNDSVTIDIIKNGQFSDRTEFKGTYLAKGDSLDINIKQIVVIDSNKIISIEPFNGKMYENATYSIKGKLLTLRYTTYPADAPVVTSSVFMRVPED